MSKNLVIPRLIPIINSSIPLFVETTGNILKTETIETHREIADAIAAGYALHLVVRFRTFFFFQKRIGINTSIRYNKSPHNNQRAHGVQTKNPDVPYDTPGL